VRARLVDLRAADAALAEHRSGWIEAVLLSGEEFVLVDDASSASRGVPRPRLPGVGGDHLSQFFLTFLANHDDFKDLCVNALSI